MTNTEKKLLLANAAATADAYEKIVFRLHSTLSSSLTLEEARSQVDRAITHRDVGKTIRALMAAVPSDARSPTEVAQDVLDTFERSASRLVSTDYAAGYREGIGHVLDELRPDRNEN